MKKLSLFLLMVSTIVMAEISVLVPAPTVSSYVPRGYDSNDEVEIFVEGYLPSLCYQSPMGSAEVQGNTIYVTMSALYYQPNSRICPEVMLPFMEKVNVGILGAGEYNVVVNNNRFDAFRVDIEMSTVVDDFLYANVDDITEYGNNIISLAGKHPADCYDLEGIDVISNGKNTYSVLPKLRQTKSVCNRVLVPFETSFEMPRTLKSKKVLLHVRTMMGQSVNRLVTQ